MLPELKSYFTPWKRPLSPKPHWKKMLLVESGQLPALALMARLQLKLQNTIWNNCLMPKSGSPMPTDPTSSKGEHVFAVGTHAYNTYKRLAICIHTDRHIFIHPKHKWHQQPHPTALSGWPGEGRVLLRLSYMLLHVPLHAWTQVFPYIT